MKNTVKSVLIFYIIFLQNRNVSDIVALVDMQNGPLIWVIVPDNEFTEEPLMPGNPEHLMSSGQFNTEIEVIIGHNSDEGLSFLLPYLMDPSLYKVYQENFDIMAPVGLFNIGNVSDITSKDVDNAHKVHKF